MCTLTVGCSGAVIKPGGNFTGNFKPPTGFGVGPGGGGNAGGGEVQLERLPRALVCESRRSTSAGRRHVQCDDATRDAQSYGLSVALGSELLGAARACRFGFRNQGERGGRDSGGGGRY